MRARASSRKASAETRASPRTAAAIAATVPASVRGAAVRGCHGAFWQVLIRSHRTVHALTVVQYHDWYSCCLASRCTDSRSKQSPQRRTSRCITPFTRRAAARRPGRARHRDRSCARKRRGGRRGSTTVGVLSARDRVAQGLDGSAYDGPSLPRRSTATRSSAVDREREQRRLGTGVHRSWRRRTRWSSAPPGKCRRPR
jgi:hypothetical protein